MSTRTVTGVSTTNEQNTTDTQASFYTRTPGSNRLMANDSNSINTSNQAPNQPSFPEGGRTLGAMPGNAYPNTPSHVPRRPASTPVACPTSPMQSNWTPSPVRPRTNLATEGWHYASTHGPRSPVDMAIHNRFNLY